jgi:hypothetical protein
LLSRWISNVNVFCQRHFVKNKLECLTFKCILSMGLKLRGRRRAYSSNLTTSILLGQKGLLRTNALAYFVVQSVTKIVK